MLTRTQAPRLAAVAVLLGSLACASPVLADNAMTAAPATAPAPTQAAAPTKHKHHHEDMQKKVEERIATLHSKLQITPEQEAAWGTVVQAMRDSEATMAGLIHDRHENAQTMTALQDLDSYQKIAQAHADSMGKFLTAFTPLYNSMSDEQKANADTVFGSFEGHNHDHDAKAPATK